MDEILYLEADEEITSVVDKLKGLECKSVGLVAPKGATIVQSLVSLKLLKKQAKELGKEISIVTSDEVGQNLASRIELPVYKDVRSRTPIEPIKQESPDDDPIEIDMAKEKPQSNSEIKEEVQEEEEELPENFQMHRYDEKKEEKEIPEESQPKQEAEDVAPQKINESEQQINPKLEENEISREGEFVQRHVPEQEKKIDRHDLESARPISQGYDQKIKSKNNRSAKAPLLFTAGALLAVLIVLIADLAIAKLNVKIQMPAEEISKSVELQIEKDRPSSDFEKGILAGTQISREKSQTQMISATSEKEIGEKAKGSLTFKNESGVDEQIVSGSTVRSINGIEFLLDSAVTVPKASLNSAGDKVLGQANGSVTAKESGSGSNLSNNTTYVVSSKPKVAISGGTNGGTTKKIKVVSKSDIENAKTKIKDSAEEEIKKPSDDQKDLVILDGAGTVELQNFSTTKNAGDEANEFEVKGTVKYTALAFKNIELKDALTKAVEKTLTQDKSLLTADTDTISSKIKDNNINVGKMTVESTLVSHVGPKVELDSMVKSWKMKPLKKVRESISKIEGAQIQDLELKPSFALPLGPILTRNIQVKIEYTKK